MSNLFTCTNVCTIWYFISYVQWFYQSAWNFYLMIPIQYFNQKYVLAKFYEIKIDVRCSLWETCSLVSYSLWLSISHILNPSIYSCLILLYIYCNASIDHITSVVNGNRLIPLPSLCTFLPDTGKRTVFWWQARSFIIEGENLTIMISWDEK